MKNKYEVYGESAVNEYWVIHPNEYTLLIYTLSEGKYFASKLFTVGDIVSSKAIEGFKLNLVEVFQNI